MAERRNNGHREARLLPLGGVRHGTLGRPGTANLHRRPLCRRYLGQVEICHLSLRLVYYTRFYVGSTSLSFVLSGNFLCHVIHVDPATPRITQMIRDCADSWIFGSIGHFNTLNPTAMM